MVRFEAYAVALEIIRGLAEVLPRIGRHDRDLVKQGRRAASSIALNLQEGSGRRGGDRTRHFSIASGSAKEVLAVLDVAEAWGYLDAEATAQLRKLLDRELALTWGLAKPTG